MGRRNHGKLNDEQKAFLVQRLACYDTLAEAVIALKERYGVEITPQGAEVYDPNKRAGRTLGPKWRDLFEATRKRFLDDVTAHVPEAHKAVRIRKLARTARALEARGNYLGMADMLERIAKELGNVHSNRRELTGRDGEPLQLEVCSLTDAQLDERIARLLTTLGYEAGNAAARVESLGVMLKY